MTGDEVLKVFEENGALLKGHFLLSSGLHSSRYLQCALVLQHPDIATQLCAALAANRPSERVISQALHFAKSLENASDAADLMRLLA